MSTQAKALRGAKGKDQKNTFKSMSLTLLKIMAFTAVLLLVGMLDIEVGGSGKAGNILSPTTFIDDMGNKINLRDDLRDQGPRIVSLSPTHTENLFAIGAGDLVMAVDDKSVYPYEAAMLARYRLDKEVDVQAIIDLKPDYILVEPKMNEGQTGLISTFEAKGLEVVSLMPESINDFSYYIEKLGMLVGRQDQAMARLEVFWTEYNHIKKTVGNMHEGQGLNVFVETSEKGYESVSGNSLIGQAVKSAGGRLIGPASKWYEDESDYPIAGRTFITDNQENIDVYLSIQGDGHRGASIISMKQNPEINWIQAIDHNRVYQIKSPLIGRYTFRYIEGIKDLNRLLYGDSGQWQEPISSSEPLTRGVFARVVFELLELQTFTIYDKDYYDHKKFNHTYGAFEDVSWQDEFASIYETVVMKSYLLPVIDEQGREHFRQDDLVDNEAISAFLYIWLDSKGEIIEEDGIKTAGDLRDLITRYESLEIGEGELDD